MIPLTLEHAIYNKFNAIDCVKYFRLDWSDKECDYWLWNETCYPMDMETTIKQLNTQLLNEN